MKSLSKEKKIELNKYYLVDVKPTGYSKKMIKIKKKQLRQEENKKRRNQEILEKKNRLNNFAKQLNENLPNSEKWFWNKYNKSGSREYDDLSNVPLGRYIFDVVNERFKYIIEVDGSYHEREDQIKKDLKKDRLAIKLGYRIIRIKAFDNDSFDSAIKRLFIIKTYFTKTILRKKK